MTFSAIPSHRFAESRARRKEIRDKPLRFPGFGIQEQGITGHIRQPSFPVSACPGEFGSEDCAAGYRFRYSQGTRDGLAATRMMSAEIPSEQGIFRNLSGNFARPKDDLLCFVQRRFLTHSVYFRLAMLAF
jgi:hypothetical protein